MTMPTLSEEDLCGAEAEGEQARGEGVAADGVDVAHPHGEQGEESPVPAAGRGEVVVDEVRIDVGDRFRGRRRSVFCWCGHELSCGSCRAPLPGLAVLVGADR